MTAMPQRVHETVPEKWSSASDEVILHRIARAAHEALVVIAAENAQFHASIHSLFSPSVARLNTLKKSSERDEASCAEAEFSRFDADRFPLVIIDMISIGDYEVQQILAVLPDSVPIVLLHAENSPPQMAQYPDNVIYTLANNSQAARNWSEILQTRTRHYARRVVLDYANAADATHIQRFLKLRNYQVVRAAERASTLFVRSSIGNQFLVIEKGESLEPVTKYIRQLRMSNDSGVLSIVVTGDLTNDAQRCELLEAGADELLDDKRSSREMLIRLDALACGQDRVQKILQDSYHFPDSIAYNADFLINVGNKLYASAQRDVITMALAMIRVVFVSSEEETVLSRADSAKLVQDIAVYCAKNLRETDLFAQAGERDFIALVTCVGRNNVARVFTRLAAEASELVERATDGRIYARLETGVTCELGTSFRSMMEKAQLALVSAEMDPERNLVIC